MVNGNPPLESLLNSIEVVKNALGPLESNIRRAAKEFEKCWSGSDHGSRTLEIVKGGTNSHLFSMKKKNGGGVLSDDRTVGLSINVPFKTFFGIFLQHDKNDARKVDVPKKRLDVTNGSKEDGTCMNCLHFAVAWSVLVSSIVQAVPGPLRTGKKKLDKKSNDEHICKHPLPDATKFKISCDIMHNESKRAPLSSLFEETLNIKDGKKLSIECFIGFVIDQLAQNLQKFEFGVQQSVAERHDSSTVVPNTSQVDHFEVVTNLLEGKRADFSGFLGTLKFARVGGVPSTIVNVSPPTKEGSEDTDSSVGTEDVEVSLTQKMANGLLSIPLSNVERLRSTLSTVSLTELIELVPQLGRTSKEDYPDKKKLFSVQDFFRYTEAEGRRFFEELDRDGDGQVTLEDLEVAIRKRRLPRRYAHEFMRRTRRHLFSKSFGWKQFLSLMEQKEATILRAYTSLCLSKSGTLKKSEILASLKNAGLPANEDNAVAMMRFLKSDSEESISYGHFRNFMLLLPSEQLQEDPRNIWFQAATVVAVAPPVEVPTGSVLKSALAGGLACALSTSVMHPIDTIKTRVQASTLSFPEILAKLPEVGVQGVYRGSIPAIIGQFSSHGLRTGIFEASKLVLINVAPDLPDIQVQSVASFCSTVLGTAVRIPCEVLKQRLQAGIFNNVGEALVCTWQQDGLKGFFRGTGATLCREVPFYVAGMGLYEESKKAAQRMLGRELQPWETIAVGALSGGLAAVTTTPFDVMKTRMMTAPQGRPVSMSFVAMSILRHEGPLGLFKGALPRFFWIAPLGAMNFAGYELMKNAMRKNEDQQPAEQQVSQK